MSMRVVGLWLCCTLFFSRVLGQVMAGLYAPAWLPPMEAWYSGLIPYPILLPVQFALLMLMAVVAAGQTRQGSGLHHTCPVLAEWLQRVAYVYALVMALRYFVAMRITDIDHWYDGGLVPIIFHWVLAVYIWLAAGGFEVRNTRVQKL